MSDVKTIVAKEETRPHIPVRHEGFGILRAEIPEKWGKRDFYVITKDHSYSTPGYYEFSVFITNINHNGKVREVNEQPYKFSTYAPGQTFAEAFEPILNNHYNHPSRLMRMLRVSVDGLLS
jgi:hypothetical protein